MRCQHVSKSEGNQCARNQGQQGFALCQKESKSQRNTQLVTAVADAMINNNLCVHIFGPETRNNHRCIGSNRDRLRYNADYFGTCVGRARVAQGASNQLKRRSSVAWVNLGTLTLLLQYTIPSFLVQLLLYSLVLI